ncbi:bifunctional 2',3'-cyclic-nucleotide 2'-phosphodiesterase/3'-nucleotidase [Aeromonas sp. MdU4]|uniref:bifunctional 2',3'-cyclic-nucleotide 2'-phosphodiesterase/3'-nucleotidase n=1 Tax=Aeromonas sp. MdU4 TaxID=3342819 RepID=UPI0035BA3FFB
MKTTLTLTSVAVLLLLSGCNSNSNGEQTIDSKSVATTSNGAPGDVNLRLIETSDIHSNLLGFDYYQNKVDHSLGLSRTALLIHKAREENANNLLIDNGDLIQGTPLSDYVFAQYKGDTSYLKKLGHPAINALNLLKYDVANLGNHEFNYGLDYLADAEGGANYPVLNANVFDARDFKLDSNGKVDWKAMPNRFRPYVLLDRQVKDVNGNVQTIKVGVMGVNPPQIMQWDRRNLEGKVVVADMVEAAEHYIPEMRAKGADLVVIVAHSGITGTPQEPFMENAALYLAQVKGLDALLLGHAHKAFPGEYPDIPLVNNKEGKIAGVPAVMPGVAGNHLGVIDLKLTHKDGRWQVASSHSELRKVDKSMDVPGDRQIEDLIQTTHDATNTWLDVPISSLAAPIYSFFSAVRDDASLQVVSDAQKWHIDQVKEDCLKANGVGCTLKEDLPVLSAVAPFRGGRNGPNDFTWVKAGDISLRNVSDLYVFPNTLQVVKVNGETVQEWLEKSACQYSQIVADTSKEQWLLVDDFRPYNLDAIKGVQYKIDITQPARYNQDGKKINDSHRIIGLTYQGKPIDPNQNFYVVTNNYRGSGGGNFPGVDSKVVVHEDPMETREVITAYVKEMAKTHPAGFEQKFDNNWSLKPLPAGVKVYTYSSTNPEAEKLAGSELKRVEGVVPKDPKLMNHAFYQLATQ